MPSLFEPVCQYDMSGYKVCFYGVIQKQEITKQMTPCSTVLHKIAGLQKGERQLN